MRASIRTLALVALLSTAAYSSVGATAVQQATPEPSDNGRIRVSFLSLGVSVPSVKSVVVASEQDGPTATVVVMAENVTKAPLGLSCDTTIPLALVDDAGVAWTIEQSSGIALESGASSAATPLLFDPGIRIPVSLVFRARRGTIGRTFTLTGAVLARAGDKSERLPFGLAGMPATGDAGWSAP